MLVFPETAIKLTNTKYILCNVVVQLLFLSKLSPINIATSLVLKASSGDY